MPATAMVSFRLAWNDQSHLLGLSYDAVLLHLFLHIIPNAGAVPLQRRLAQSLAAPRAAFATVAVSRWIIHILFAGRAGLHLDHLSSADAGSLGISSILPLIDLLHGVLCAASM